MTFHLEQLGHLRASAPQREAIAKAITDNVYTEYGAYGCFEPRHVIVLTMKGHRMMPADLLRM